MKIPILADKNLSISRDYGVLLEDAGIAFRYDWIRKISTFFQPEKYFNINNSTRTSKRLIYLEFTHSIIDLQLTKPIFYIFPYILQWSVHYQW